METQKTAGRAAALAWTALVTSALIQIVALGPLVYTQGILAVYWVKQWGVSRGLILLGSVLCVQLSGFLGIFVGRMLASKVPEYLLIAAGAVFGALTFAAFAFATEVWQVILAYCLLGSVAAALAGPLVGQALAVRLFRKPGVPLSIVTLGVKGGAVFAPVIVALLLEHYSLKAALGLTALLVLACAPLVLLLVRPGSKLPDVADESGGAAGAAEAPNVSTLKILRDPTFLGLFLMCIAVIGLSGAVYVNLPLYVVELGGKPSDAAFIFSGATIVSALFTPLVGWASDRVDLRILMVLPLLFVATSVALLSLFPTLPFIIAAIPFISFTNAVFLPCYPVCLKARFGQALFPRAMGLSQPFFYSTNLVALLAGILRDHLPSYPATFQAISVLLVAGVGGYFLVARTVRTRAV